MDIDTKTLHLKFEGLDMESGRIDAADFIQTVTATTESLRFIGKEVGGAKNKQVQIDIVALREGSFEVDLAITVKDLEEIAPGLVPLLVDVHIISTAKQLIEILKSLLEVKKILKGEKPSKVEIIQNDGSPHVAIHGNGGTVNVNITTFNLLQSEGMNKRLHKIFQPLLKEDSQLESIEISDEEKQPTEVNKIEAAYFKKEEQLQTVAHRMRGIITAMDRKTNNGKISIGDKRVNFEVELKDISKLDKVIDGLIESMKTKVAIIVIGEAAFDYESNLRHIRINDIERDDKLFE